MKPTEYENAVVIETIAEQLWQADSLRATGRKRQVPWREAPEQDHAKFRDFASTAIKAIKPFAVAASAWQPIDTAPKDGTEVLVCTCHKEVLLARFVAGEWWVHDWLLTEIMPDAPTHWMPLPEPPHLALNKA